MGGTSLSKGVESASCRRPFFFFKHVIVIAVIAIDNRALRAFFANCLQCLLALPGPLSLARLILLQGKRGSYLIISVSRFYP